MKNSNKIIVALDTHDILEAKKLVKTLFPRVNFFKIGLEFINTGQAPELIKFIHKLGGKILYDIKLNDIPNTVGKTIKVISKMGVTMITVHASMGRESLRAAVQNRGKSKILGVTVLTSLNDIECESIFGNNSKNKVLQFASILFKEKCDGIICSAWEAKLIRNFKKFNKLSIAIPGIRPAWANQDEQARAVTPEESILAGADYLIIGRPITYPPEKIGGPKESLELIRKGIEN